MRQDEQRLAEIGAIRLRGLSVSDRAEAVAAFDRLYGEMERALARLAWHCREPLMEGRSTPVVESLVWTVKSWWGVQGVRTETQTVMAEALATLDWPSGLFDPLTQVPFGAPGDAYARVSALVGRGQALGLVRREFSLASKVLHLLLPFRVPVYDSFVRTSLGIPTGWDHPAAYRQMSEEVFAAARAFEGDDPGWLGRIEPASPLRGLDKCLWWLGGGSEGRAALVRDPWRPLRQLGLPTG
jgi:hypothetical protein